MVNWPLKKIINVFKHNRCNIKVNVKLSISKLLQHFMCLECMIIEITSFHGDTKFIYSIESILLTVFIAPYC